MCWIEPAYAGACTKPGKMARYQKCITSPTLMRTFENYVIIHFRVFLCYHCKLEWINPNVIIRPGLPQMFRRIRRVGNISNSSILCHFKRILVRDKRVYLLGVCGYSLDG